MAYGVARRPDYNRVTLNNIRITVEIGRVERQSVSGEHALSVNDAATVRNFLRRVNTRTRIRGTRVRVQAYRHYPPFPLAVCSSFDAYRNICQIFRRAHARIDSRNFLRNFRDHVNQSITLVCSESS